MIHDSAITIGTYGEWARLGFGHRYEDEGEFLTGRVTTVVDGQTFLVRSSVTGRTWECRHFGDGQVIECSVVEEA